MTKAADIKKALISEYLELEGTKCGIFYKATDAFDQEMLKLVDKMTVLHLRSQISKMKIMADWVNDGVVVPDAIKVYGDICLSRGSGSGSSKTVTAPGITDAQLALIIKLSLEKAGIDLLDPARADLLNIVKQHSKTTASAHISAALKLPRFTVTGRIVTDNPPMQSVKRTAPAPTATPEIPEGIYGIHHDGEVKCYLVDYGKAGGQWDGYLFLSRISSDDKYAIRNQGEKARILAAIKDMGIEKSSILAGHTLRQCRRCRRTLSDTKNPYFDIALGPDCGGK